MYSLYIDKIKFAVLAIYIVLMSTQIIAIEGGGPISLIKVGAMAVSPLVFIILGYERNVSTCIICGISSIVVMAVCAILSSPNVAWPRIGYRTMYVAMFICANSIICEKRVNLNDIKRLLKILIITYGVTIALQHIALLLGIKEMLILNLYGNVVTMTGVFKPNGLSLEPSHSARILTVLYWGYLKILEIQNGKPTEFKDTWRKYKIETILFWFSMLTMGSATAIIGCALILLYFFKKNGSLIFTGCLLFVVIMNMDIDNVQISRIQVVFNSLFSNDIADSLESSEASGAVRLMPIINTLSNLDLFSLSSWIGQGSVQNLNMDFSERMFSATRYIGDVADFGLLTYLSFLLLVYKCSIRRFFSMESLMFLCLATFSVGSVYYTWLMLIIFGIVKYYTESYNKIENVSHI